MVATVAGTHLAGIHSARPAGNAVPDGSLYSCSTHSLIYASNFAGNSWSTWATLGTSGAIVDPMTTRGDMIIRDASNVTARLGHGSAGTYLGSDGTDLGFAAVTDAQLSTSDITTNNASTTKHGFAPKYPNDATKYLDGTGAYTVPAGGGGSSGLPMLEAHTASSSASLDFTTCISSTYDDYLIEFVGILPASNGVDLLMRMGAGSFDSGANYKYIGWYNGIGDVLTGTGASGQTAINVANSVRNDATNLVLSGSWKLYGPGSTAAYKSAGGVIVAMAAGAGNLYRWDLSGAWFNTSAADRFQFLFSSGNIASGTIRVYGINKT